MPAQSVSPIAISPSVLSLIVSFEVLSTKIAGLSLPSYAATIAVSIVVRVTSAPFIIEIGYPLSNHVLTIVISAFTPSTVIYSSE